MRLKSIAWVPTCSLLFPAHHPFIISEIILLFSHSYLSITFHNEQNDPENRSSNLKPAIIKKGRKKPLERLRRLQRKLSNSLYGFLLNFQKKAVWDCKKFLHERSAEAVECQQDIYILLFSHCSICYYCITLFVSVNRLTFLPPPQTTLIKNVCN